MIIQTSELIGKQLNWAVAKYETLSGYRHGFRLKDNTPYWRLHSNEEPCYASTLWEQGGRILDREDISIIRVDDDYGVDAQGFCNNVRIPVWAATSGQHGIHSSYEGENYESQYEIPVSDVTYGPTQLVAGLRRFVFMRAGVSVDVPDELTF